MIVGLWTRRKRRRRWHCLECGGFLLRRYKGTRIHRKCWLAIEAGINDE